MWRKLIKNQFDFDCWLGGGRSSLSPSLC